MPEKPNNPPNAPAPVGRPLEGTAPRISRTISIDPATDAYIAARLVRLHTRHPKASPGKVIDRMATFCDRKKFDPLKVRPPEPPKIKKKPAALPQARRHGAATSA